MAQYTVHTAKTELSRLIARAEAGEEVVIARGNVPAVRLVPLSAPRVRRKFGALRGKVVVTDAFFEPLPADELEAWGQ
jgi:prevent-host-death family protein